MFVLQTSNTGHSPGVTQTNFETPTRCNHALHQFDKYTMSGRRRRRQVILGQQLSDIEQIQSYISYPKLLRGWKCSSRYEIDHMDVHSIRVVQKHEQQVVKYINH